MNQPPRDESPARPKLLSRRSLLHKTTASAVLALAAAGPPRAEAAGLRQGPGPAPDTPPGADPRPDDPFRGVLQALGRFPLVAVGEMHFLQEWHDFLTALLFHPDLPGQVNDVVVEFGNAKYQDVADRFVLDGQPVANAELARIWRHTLGGGVLWDAPVYPQFFRTLRAVNWMRPKANRIRVLLGDPAFDYRKAAGDDGKAYLRTVFNDRDPHYAAVVEREVLGKGRRALLLAGTGHIARNVKNDRTGQPNAATLLDRKHSGQLFVVLPLVPSPRDPKKAGPADPEQAALGWPRPSLATMAGTSIGERRGPLAHRAVDPSAARFRDQADAALYLGPAEELTASRPDPSLYQAGTYADELKQHNEALKRLGLRARDALAFAQAGPRYFP
jgi:hypothetical protein